MIVFNLNCAYNEHNSKRGNIMDSCQTVSLWMPDVLAERIRFLAKQHGIRMDETVQYLLVQALDPLLLKKLEEEGLFPD